MSIQFTCGNCGKRLKVADEAAGKRGRCPGCGAVVQVPTTPDPGSSAPALVSTASEQRLEAVPLRRVDTPELPRTQPVPTVNINNPRRTSSLGIVSLILGIVAFLICWIPILGLFGIPLSALGLVLGVTGLIVTAVRKGAGIGFPIAGSAVCGMALVVAITSTYAAGRALEGAADAMGEAMQEDTQTNQQIVSAADETPSRASSNKPKRPKRKQPPSVARESEQPREMEEPREPKWASARNAVRQGEVELRIVSVLTGKVPLMATFPDREGTSESDLLTIEIQLTNLSHSKKIEYHSWLGRDISFGRDFAALEDNFDNTYKRISFGFGTEVIGHTESESIYPGKSLSDVLVFELPVDAVEYLNLELPGKNVGGSGMFRLRIPAKMIRRR